MYKVKVRCSRCGKEIYVPTKNYYSTKKYYCDKCKRILEGDLENV